MTAIKTIDPDDPSNNTEDPLVVDIVEEKKALWLQCPGYDGYCYLDRKAVWKLIKVCQSFLEQTEGEPPDEEVPPERVEPRADRMVSRRLVVKALRPGSKPFPIDMLRYNNCFPATLEDANKIESLGWGYASGKNGDHDTEIALTRFAWVETDDPVTKETGMLATKSLVRWKGVFHWEVVEDKLLDMFGA